MSVVRALLPNSALPTTVYWRGQSGRHYSLSLEQYDDFYLEESMLYMLTSGDVPLWVGSALDLIEDPASRLKFKKAMKSCSNVYRCQMQDAAIPSQHTIWDLENGQVAGHLRLVEVS
jgi:hypothetical protein